MTRSLTLALGLPLLLAACDRGGGDDAAAPSGLYTLQRTGEGALPAVLGSREGCTYTAQAGHVALLDDGRYEAMLVRGRDCETPEAGADTVFMDQGQGAFSSAGDSLRFLFDNGGTAGVGVFRGDTLTVEGPGQTMHYVRDAQLSEELLQTDTAR